VNALKNQVVFTLPVAAKPAMITPTTTTAARGDECFAST
jgi:hypothetical protein